MIQTEEQRISLEEHLISLDAYRAMRPSIDGKPMAITTAHRHIKKGIKGVRLAAIRYGGRICTSVEAVERFWAALEAAAEAGPPAPEAPRPRPGGGASRSGSGAARRSWGCDVTGRPPGP
jgi:hypothetical protein